ncbi:CopD family protein [Archaeoglobus neptunius]|uniref:CopD family protein n=1 Tax=Archaeoglobus neptunius TaxID=2798580 RepID=UPI001927AC10|nr:CopD family protein [Archaeoglobus neptunius]
MENVVVFGMVKGLHDLATAIWVGGLIHMSATILPSFKDTGDEVVKRQILMTLQSRLSLLVYASIAVLVITGVLESWHSKSFLGFFSFENTYSSLLSLKHVLVVAMILIAAVRQILLRKMKKAGKKIQMDEKQLKKIKAKEGVLFSLVLINATMGVIAIFLSGYIAAFS